MATLSIDEVRHTLVNLLPPGADKLYDLTPTGDVFKLFDALAAAVKQFGYDLLESLRAEIIPSSAIQKLPDWEKALGLTSTFAASSGTPAQRQAGVLSKLREFGSFTPYIVRSIVAPLLGYADFTQLRVLETRRADLTALHTYVDSPPGNQGTIPASGSLIRPMYLPDGGSASRAGAQVTLWISHPAVQGLTATLTAPSGKSKSWRNFGRGAVVNQPFLLYGVEFSGTQCNVQWNLTVSDASGNAGTLVRWQLFIEGVAGNGLGGAVFDWGVYADPAQLGATQPADYAGAKAAISRIKHAHTNGHIIRSIAPAPDSSVAVPDQCAPG
jgi:hypothetical protein